MQILQKSLPYVAVTVLATGLAACGSNPFSNPFGASSLRPAPTQPVSNAALPPPSTASVEETTAVADDAATTAAEEPATQVAAFGPADPDKMSGGWTITDSSGSCSLFMSTTAWTGGFRAVTRGCPSSNLQSVNAWNVVDGKIALKDASGTEIARLTRTGDTKFDGGFSSGGRVSFSR